MDEYNVEIPNHQWRYQMSSKQQPKYWQINQKLPIKWKDKISDKVVEVGGKKYYTDKDGNRIVKNTKSVGNPKWWVVNGQDLYNGNLHPQVRSKLTSHYHNYLKAHILQQIPLMNTAKGDLYTISCEIYEAIRPQSPDPSNLWPWIKWFEDCLQELDLIPNDNRKSIHSTGTITVYNVLDPAEERIVFNIKRHPITMFEQFIKSLDTVIALTNTVDKPTTNSTIFIEEHSQYLDKFEQSLITAKSWYISLVNKVLSSNIPIDSKTVKEAIWGNVDYNTKIFEIESAFNNTKRLLNDPQIKALRSIDSNAYQAFNAHITEAGFHLIYELNNLDKDQSDKEL